MPVRFSHLRTQWRVEERDSKSLSRAHFEGCERTNSWLAYFFLAWLCLINRHQGWERLSSSKNRQTRHLAGGLTESSPSELSRRFIGLGVRFDVIIERYDEPEETAVLGLFLVMTFMIVDQGELLTGFFHRWFMTIIVYISARSGVLVSIFDLEESQSKQSSSSSSSGGKTIMCECGKGTKSISRGTLFFSRARIWSLLHWLVGIIKRDRYELLFVMSRENYKNELGNSSVRVNSSKFLSSAAPSSSSVRRYNFQW